LNWSVNWCYQKVRRQKVYKPLLILVCGFLFTVSLSGCFGMISYQPGECEKETPKLQNKAEYLKEKGAPGSTRTVSADREVWLYEESLWCGVIPCWGICVPLMLPVCDGFERVHFKGDRAERVHARHSLGYGGFFNVLNLAGIPPGSIAVSDPACIRRLARAGSLGQKIEPGRTVALSVGIDTPKHKQDKEFQKVARRLRDVLAADLVKEDSLIFKTVVAEGQSADYAMEVTLTSATFTSFFNRQYEAEMAVRITDNRTNQPLGDFEIYSMADKLRNDDSTFEFVIEMAVGDIRGAIIWYEDSSQSPDIHKPDEDLSVPPETGAIVPPPPL
jgi:hypothetical protein